MNHEFYMNLALLLAEKGYANTFPNPMVGAVIVKDEKILGQGYHEYFGGSHAEVNAIKNCHGENLFGASLYVTLEPCCHHGKTPPCTDAIIKSGIKKVFIAMLDPSPHASGKGVEILKSNGIDVEIGILESKSRNLNYEFLTVLNEKRPFFNLKQASTLDGKLSPRNKTSKGLISSLDSRIEVHKMRSAYDGVLVGSNTVIIDDPILDCRLIEKPNKLPVRIVLDSFLEAPSSSKIFDTALQRTLVFHSSNVLENRVTALKKLGVSTCSVSSLGHQLNLEEISSVLYEMGLLRILIEGGSTLSSSFLESGLLDRYTLFMSPRILADNKSLSTFSFEDEVTLDNAFSLYETTIEKLGDDFKVQGNLR